MWEAENYSSIPKIYPNWLKVIVKPYTEIINLPSRIFFFFLSPYVFTERKGKKEKISQIY